MRTILTSFDVEVARRGLVRELAGVDDRQLLDMGLVRAADGSLWLAEDPSRQVAPEPLRRRFSAFLEPLARFFSGRAGPRNVALGEHLRPR